MWKWIKKKAKEVVQVLVRVGQAILRVCHVVAQTCVAVTIAGAVGVGPGSLATLAGNATAATFTQAQLTIMGTAIAGTVHVSLSGAAAAALASTVVSLGFAALFVLAFWLLMKLLKPFIDDLLEALDDLTETGDVLVGLA